MANQPGKRALKGSMHDVCVCARARVCVCVVCVHCACV